MMKGRQVKLDPWASQNSLGLSASLCP